MNKILITVLLILVFVIIGELFYYGYLASKTSKNIVTNTISPTQILDNRQSLKILYKAKDDNEGRTIIYDNNPGWRGAGKQFLFPWLYAVGIFDHWETIKNTKNRYLYLTNPLAGKPLEKIIVLFESRELAPNFKKETKLQVENLRKFSTGSGGEVERFAQLSKISDEKLDGLLRQGDAILVFLATKYQMTFVSEDAQKEIHIDNAAVALSITLRRYEGAKELSQSF